MSVVCSSPSLEAAQGLPQEGIGCRETLEIALRYRQRRFSSEPPKKVGGAAPGPAKDGFAREDVELSTVGTPCRPNDLAKRIVGRCLYVQIVVRTTEGEVFVR